MKQKTLEKTVYVLLTVVFLGLVANFMLPTNIVNIARVLGLLAAFTICVVMCYALFKELNNN